MYNLNKLSTELQAANIPFTGISSDGVISYSHIATNEQKELAKNLVDAHKVSVVSQGIIEGDNLTELLSELEVLGIAVLNVSSIGIIEYDTTPISIEHTDEDGNITTTEEARPTQRQIKLAENTVINHIAKVKSRGIVDTEAMEAVLIENDIAVESVDIKGVIEYSTVATAEQKIIAAGIVAAHDPSPTYIELRTGPDGYASLGDQSDMRYKDEINGTTTWVDHVTSVKVAFSKPIV